MEVVGVAAVVAADCEETKVAGLTAVLAVESGMEVETEAEMAEEDAEATTVSDLLKICAESILTVIWLRVVRALRSSISISMLRTCSAMLCISKTLPDLSSSLDLNSRESSQMAKSPKIKTKIVVDTKLKS